MDDTRTLPKNAHLIPSDAKQVFKGEIFEVYQWQQELYDGTFETFEMLKRPDTVTVIALDGDDVIVLDEEQPNGIVRRDSLPGGRVDPVETPIEAVKRELEEETGYQFNDWILLNVVQPEKKLEWFRYLYVAYNKTSEVETRHGAGERIEVKKISFVDFKNKYKDDIHELRGIDTAQQLTKVLSYKHD